MPHRFIAESIRVCVSPLMAIVLVFLAQRLTPVVSSLRQYQKEITFYKLSETSLIGNQTKTTRAEDAFDCSFLCLSSYPVNCLSFNFGGPSVDGSYTCELSNNELALAPNTSRMVERAGFDYYGVKKEHLPSNLLLCLARPCKNGGTCTNGPNPGQVACLCPLEINVLPYNDDKCNFDVSLVTMQGSSTENVFWARVGMYKLNYYEAERLCEILGAILASYDQLFKAWEAGLESCQWGWLIDATIRYPMQSVNKNCGKKIGVIGNTVKQAKETLSNAWCYKLSS